MTMDVTANDDGMIRAGLLGAGFMARVHSTAIRVARGEVSAIATSTPERALIAAHELGAQRAYATAEELLAANLDVIHVLTPNSLHASLATAALERGHHVVCEKPLATSASAAHELVERAAATDRVAAVPFVYRYHGMVREARSHIASGRLGSILSIQGAYLQDWMLSDGDAGWRAGATGGPSRAFADIGSHLCDLIEFVTGERIAALSARTRRVFDERAGAVVDNEDIVAVLFETHSGALGTMLVSQMAPGRKNALSIELHGSTRSARFEQERAEELWIGERTGSRLLLRDPDTASPANARLQVLPAGHALGYQDAFNAFVGDVHDAIRGGHPDGLPTFGDGLRAAILTDAVLQSATAGGWTEVTS